MREISVETSQTVQMLEITDLVANAVRASGIEDGVCHIFIPHTTAGLTINENADPDVCHDILRTLDKLIPPENGYRHAEGNSAAHVKASLFGSSLTVLLAKGKLMLGKWQGIYLCEFDGPRRRKVWIKVMANADQNKEGGCS